MKRWSFGLVLALSLLAISRGLVRDVSRFFLFPVSQVAAAAPPSDFVLDTLAARDGVAVHALELPAGGRTVVYFHSNRETAESRADLARALHLRGLGVLMVEYRGYGSSRDGSPSEEGLYLDAEAALDMLAARGIGPDRIVLWGASLGTGVAAEMARRGRGAALVLVAPYTSIPDLVTDVAPFVPASVLLDDRFETLAKSDAIRVPTLVIHGDADEIVPFAMGVRVANAIPGARLVRVAGGHHGDLFERDRDELLSAIASLTDAK